MRRNNLYLIRDSTELTFINRKESRTITAPPSATIGDNIIYSVKQVHNLCIMFDEHMKMDAQISSMCSAGHFHLRTADSAECLIHAFITSCQCAPIRHACIYQLSRLHRLQNAAARVVSRTKKYEHKSPVLKSLHWLPVESQIKYMYKLLLLTFKSPRGLAPL